MAVELDFEHLVPEENRRKPNVELDFEHLVPEVNRKKPNVELNFDHLIPPENQDRPVAQNWKPSLLESVQGVFGANKERASNELAARRIAEREGVSTSSVYESVGGHQPMLNPEGRNPAVALTEGAKVVAQQAPDIIPSIENTALRAIRGGRDTVADDSWLDREITATDRPPPEDADPNYAKLQGLGKSAGYSLTTMGATLGASIPAGMATTPAGGVAAGMAASGAVSFRGSKDEFLDQALKKMNADSIKLNGRPINQAEWDDAQEKLNTAANKYGAWEAIPEAVGNAVLLGTITKGLKGAVLGQASEQATETMTGVGQNRAEYEAGLTNEKIGIDEAWRNQALQTALLAGGMQAAGAGAQVAPAGVQVAGSGLKAIGTGLNAAKNAVVDRFKNKSQDINENTVNIYADQSPPPQQSGLGNLIARGEGGYGSFNRGKAGDAGGAEIDFSQMTVRELMQAQALPKGDPNRIFAFGKYQIIPETMAESVAALGISPDEKVTPELQERIFSGYLTQGKRPDIAGFIRGEHNDIRKAQLAGAQEWASIADYRTGLSFHGGVGNNKASISADQFGAALQQARRAYAESIAEGKTPDEAWSAAVGSSGGMPLSTAAPSPTINNPAQNTTETNPPESTTPDSTTSPSLTDAINPALQAGTEAMQAAQAPMDSPTESAQPESLVETVQNAAAKPIEPTTVETTQAEAVPTPTTAPASEVQPVVNEPAPLTDLNQAQAAPIEPVQTIEPVEANPAPVAVDEPKLFSVAADEAEQFRANLDKALSDRRSVDVPITVGKSPEVFKAVGIPDLPVVISRDTVRKATNGVKHNVPIDVVRNLPSLLADPAMIFDSDSVAGAKVVAIESVDASGRPVIVALQVAQKARSNQLEVNRIASIYGRDKVQAVQSWIDKGLLRYVHPQKSQQWFQSGGLQLPNEGITAGTKANVLTNEDIVKRSQQSPSTGRTRSGLSVSGVQAELAAKLGDARVKRLQLLGKLVLADNPPADGVQGSYQNGVVTLYSDNIQQGDAWGVFLHEAGEHASLEQMLGAEKYALVVSSFDKLVKSGNADAIRAAERVPANTPEQHVAAERLAYLIEDFTNNTLKTGGAKNLVRRVIAALRAWAFAKLPAWARPQELSVADIQALAVRAARAWASSATAETGSNSQAVEKQEDVNGAETSGDVLYSFGEKIAKQLYDPDEVVRQKGVVSFVKRMVDGNYGSVHQVIRSINTPTARELADIFEVHADPDVRTNDYYIHDFHTDVSKGIGKYNTQLNAILKPLRKGRLDRVSKANGYALVRGLHTGIVPDHLVDTALALRKFLDELRDYQQAAGLSLDYLRNYFPRMYDVSKVLNQQKAFTAVLESHGLSKNAARDVINKIVNGDGLIEADKADDSERITPEEADAAPDTAEDEADPDTAKQGKEKNLRRRLSRVNGVEGSAGKAKHQKHRSLHKIPYEDLAPFLNNNLEEILVRYVSAAVRKAEYARRFGEREQQLNQMVAKIVKELQAGERINSGSFADAWKNMGGRTTGEAVRFIYSAADALQGKYKPIENDTARNANTVVSNTITQLLLPLAALSSLVEFVTSPIRGQSFRSSSVGLMHGVAYALKRAVDSAGLVVTGRHLIKSEGHYAELAEQLGIVTQDALMERLAEQAAFAGGNNKLANLSNWSTQKFMTYTLQEPIMKMQKVAALATYHRVVRQWAKTTDKPVSVRKLREFGIDPVQAKEWAEGGFKENSPAMFAINAGSIRFVNSVVTTPTSTNRPLFTQDPHFRLFYQFSTFQKVFTNTLYRYILTNLVNSKVTKVEKLRIVATMALMMGVAMAAQALRDWWKYGDERKEKTGAEWAGIGIDRSGFTGNFAPIYEFFWPYRHGYYDNAAVRAASLFGPAFSTLVKNMDAFSISEKTGAVNAKKAAKQLVNDIPYVNALPRKGQLSAPRKALEGAIEEGFE